VLSDRCLSCPICLSVLSCPVCNVGVLWPNGWMDQDETWYAGRPRPWPHCVRWGPSSPPKGYSPQFSAHICCSQMAAWIKTPFGKEVGLGPSYIVLDGDPAPLPQRGTAPIFDLLLLLLLLLLLYHSLYFIVLLYVLFYCTMDMYRPRY